MIKLINKTLTAALLMVLNLIGFESCNTYTNDPEHAKKEIATMLDSFNKAAAKGDYNTYFNFYADGAIFTGTDATEHWDKQQFMIWAKPHFDKKKTWDFTAIDRHIFLDKTGSFAWFDELLKTQMKICRGSGVLEKQGNEWKIKQYILSMTIPNIVVDTILKIKAPMEDSIIQRLITR